MRQNTYIVNDIQANLEQETRHTLAETWIWEENGISDSQNMQPGWDVAYEGDFSKLRLRD